LAGLIPLPDKIKAVALLENTKLTGQSTFLPLDIPIEKPASPTSLLHPSLRQPISFTEINSLTEFEQFHIPSLNTLRIFTDGSRHDNVVGAAFVAIDSHDDCTVKKFKLHPTCSVYQAELLAIDGALHWLLHLHSLNKLTHIQHIFIFSDSHSSLMELSNSYSHNPLAVRIFHSLLSIRSSKFQINFAWVRAHINIPGNEMADIAAKSAASLHRSPDYIHTPISYIKLKIKTTLSDSSHKFYDNSSGSIYTKNLFPTYSDLLKFTSAIKPTFIVTQFLTNHAFHKSYLFRFHITPDDLCPCSFSDIQTFHHLLFICPRFALSRFDLFSTLSYDNLLPDDPSLIINILSKPASLNAFLKHLTIIVQSLKHFNST